MCKDHRAGPAAEAWDTWLCTASPTNPLSPPSPGRMGPWLSKIEKRGKNKHVQRASCQGRVSLPKHTCSAACPPYSLPSIVFPFSVGRDGPLSDADDASSATHPELTRGSGELDPHLSAARSQRSAHGQGHRRSRHRPVVYRLVSRRFAVMPEGKGTSLIARRLVTQ